MNEKVQSRPNRVWKWFCSIATVREIKASAGPHWKEAGSFTFFNAVGGLLPLWGTYLVFKLFSKDVSASEFLEHGEFALYAAAFIAPVIYIIIRDSKNAFANRGFYVLISVVALLVAALVFGSITAMQNLAVLKEPFKLNATLLEKLSYFLIIISLSISFLVTLLDNVRSNVDLKSINQAAEKDLENQFDKLST